MIIVSPIVQLGWIAVIDGVARAMVAKYFYEAEPHWPEDDQALGGAPNVIVVVLDDVGFARLGCYGSDIATPHIDALAAEGLQYTNFHTTALCSASRASLLTGRNHHRNGMGRVIELATGFPGYNARIPRSSGFLSELRAAAGPRHIRPGCGTVATAGVGAGVVLAQPG
jgi:Sulfatase